MYQVRFEEVFCQDVGFTCWEKFHSFYLPNGLFNDNGRIRRSSTLYKSWKKLQTDQQAAEELTRQSSGVSPFPGSDMSTDHGPISPYPNSPYPGHESTDYGASPRTQHPSYDSTNLQSPRTHHDSTDYGLSPHTHLRPDDSAEDVLSDNN